MWAMGAGAAMQRASAVLLLSCLFAASLAQSSQALLQEGLAVSVQYLGF
jgi:hypothetical protein